MAGQARQRRARIVEPVDSHDGVAFDDCGIDVIYYETDSRSLYVVQGKLKKGEDFAKLAREMT